MGDNINGNEISTIIYFRIIVNKRGFTTCWTRLGVDQQLQVINIIFNFIGMNNQKKL